MPCLTTYVRTAVECSLSARDSWSYLGNNFVEDYLAPAFNMKSSLKTLIVRPFSSSTSAPSLPRVIGLPESSRVDEKLSVSLRDLPPKTLIDVKLSLTNGLNLNYESSATYQTDDNGRVDMDEKRPVRGGELYWDSMGIFRALKPLPGGQERAATIDARTPLSCHLTLSDSHRLLHEERFQRAHIGPGVTCTDVNSGLLKAKLFTPEVPSKSAPPVITFDGGMTKRQVMQERAATLASRGVPSMAVAFFGQEGLPRRWNEKPLQLDIVEMALDYLAALGYERASVYGTSKGGEMALAACALFPDRIARAVLVNTLPGLCLSSGNYRGQLDALPIMYATLGEEARQISEEYVSIEGWDAEDAATMGKTELMIPFWRCPSPVFFAASGDDRFCRATRLAEMAVAAASMEKLTARSKRMRAWAIWWTTATCQPSRAWPTCWPSSP